MSHKSLSLSLDPPSIPLFHSTTFTPTKSSTPIYPSFLSSPTPLMLSQTMALPYYIFPYLLLLLLPSTSESKLTLDYYSKTCPKLSQIITEVVTQKQISTPTTAAATLRLFFHDCMVDGCDASVLVTSNSFIGAAERDADINLSLPGDGLDVVTRAKTAVELQCPGIVSCADVLAIAARDLVTMVGGPYYNVRLGRKDGLTSKASEVGCVGTF